MIKVSSGNLDVIASGIVRTGNEPELTFRVEELTFKFIFISNKGEQNMNFEGDNETKTLTITLVNHDSHIGSGIAAPAHVGTFNDKKIYISFEVRRPSMEYAAWSLEYTFYTGE